ncbi:hypothetical protein [Cellulomonas denverensis]|uniref:Uncharacterized protein n=1 Tax=Cellulomonas denverensis TaxID=264297 RepID=A0A7X6KSU3_9CELL|nr:hypothetical protein [Cellulomonas denverensis]NKY21373.1 hypothetical protein [Cellulomonas denverensis]GIG27060.1 hypothetical protein Cde04nite_33040 [Cellulomonas denverensis]
MGGKQVGVRSGVVVDTSRRLHRSTQGLPAPARVQQTAGERGIPASAQVERALATAATLLGQRVSRTEHRLNEHADELRAVAERLSATDADVASTAGRLEGQVAGAALDRMVDQAEQRQAPSPGTQPSADADSSSASMSGWVSR